MNWRMLDCIDGLADVGYVAAIVCSKDQVLRPSSSTSGGHSGCVSSYAAPMPANVRPAAAVVAEILAALDCDSVDLVDVEVDFRIIAIHAEPEVQLRQGLPSLSSTTPLGSLR
jgi:hypothetical protein